jgi:hypothetical protein
MVPTGGRSLKKRKKTLGKEAAYVNYNNYE